MVKIHFLNVGHGDCIIIENFDSEKSNAFMKSLSCANPVVAFDVGGNGDMIEHKKMVI